MEMLLDRDIQDKVTVQMRDTHREETLIGLIQDKDRWLEDILTKQLDGLQIGQDKIIGELGIIHRNSERTNNILTTIHMTLSKLAEQRRSND